KGKTEAEAARPADGQRRPAATAAPRRPRPANGRGPTWWLKRSRLADSFALFSHARRGRRWLLLRFQQDSQAAAQSPQPAGAEHAEAQQKPAKPQPQLGKVRGAVRLDLLHVRPVGL